MLQDSCDRIAHRWSAVVCIATSTAGQTGAEGIEHRARLAAGTPDAAFCIVRLMQIPASLDDGQLAALGRRTEPVYIDTVWLAKPQVPHMDHLC